MQLLVEDGRDGKNLNCNSKVADLLLQFSEVFEEPQGLPPQRSHDHAIVLKKGVQQVGVRPYSSAYFQKKMR